MRPVRILLVAIALLAVGLTGWAFGTRGGGYSAPEATPPHRHHRPAPGRARGSPGPGSRSGPGRRRA